jgi:uncharacterized protein YbjT (DUF2867 family)
LRFRFREGDANVIVLLTGASGFIGSHLAEALVAAGHQVRCVVRNPRHGSDARFRYVQADYTKDVDLSDWLPRIAGVDTVINAVGIIREQGGQTFELLHERAPCALFSACVQGGVQLVVQISALGANEQARSRYHLSKKRADDFLAALPVQSVIIQPSLVFGQGGTSARLFTTLASLPLIGLPGTGEQQIQPVHIDDLVCAVITLLHRHAPRPARVAVVGPAAITLRDFLLALRLALGMGKARFLPIPMLLVRIAARTFTLLPGSILDTETLEMLERGNTASAAAITELLERPPRAPSRFIPAAEARSVRQLAQLNWLLPALRATIAIVWIVTGIVSLGVYPVEESYALLARVGITGLFASLMLYGAALLDLAFGIATLVLKRRRLLWLAQVAVIVFYTAVISWRLPEFWLHPYGPLLKNLPMLAAIWLLLEMEKR